MPALTTGSVLPEGFDPIAGPKAERRGTEGTVRWGRAIVGHLTDWRIVTSPTTGRLTLIGTGRFKRYFVGAPGLELTATVQPAPTPYLVGRPKPTRPKPLTLRWETHTLTATELVLIAQG